MEKYGQRWIIVIDSDGQNWKPIDILSRTMDKRRQQQNTIDRDGWRQIEWIAMDKFLNSMDKRRQGWNIMDKAK